MITRLKLQGRDSIPEALQTNRTCMGVNEIPDYSMQNVGMKYFVEQCWTFNGAWRGKVLD